MHKIHLWLHIHHTSVYMYAKDSSIVTDDIIETFIPPPTPRQSTITTRYHYHEETRYVTLPLRRRRTARHRTALWRASSPVARSYGTRASPVYVT